VEPDQSQLLAQLADIHEAAQPPLWPPAMGWWLLGLVLLLLVSVTVRFLLRRAALRRRRRTWLLELSRLAQEHQQHADPGAYLAGLNRLFRAVALRAFPGSGCARLEGESWVAFLTGLLPEDADTENLAALARGPYQPAPEFEVKSLERLARLWVERYG
jgi:hypothetical protein